MNTSSQAKKSRLLWSSQLHSRFLAAVNVLGVDSATPSQILELMNVEFLTREQVKSHLQKYKLNLNRTEEAASKKNNNPDTDRKTSLLEKLKLIEGTLQSSRLEREKLEVQLNQQKVLAVCVHLCINLQLGAREFHREHEQLTILASFRLS